MPMVGGGKHKSNNNNNNNNNELKTAKIMEDLVVPSSLYYHKPTTKDKVFNYKKGKANKANRANNEKKGSDSDSDDNVIDESLYDKLLSLVSSDKRVKYDKKTRKVMDKHGKGVKRESRESGENRD